MITEILVEKLNGDNVRTTQVRLTSPMGLAELYNWVYRKIGRPCIVTQAEGSTLARVTF